MFVKTAIGTAIVAIAVTVSAVAPASAADRSHDRGPRMERTAGCTSNFFSRCRSSQMRQRTTTRRVAVQMPSKRGFKTSVSSTKKKIGKWATKEAKHLKPQVDFTVGEGVREFKMVWHMMKTAPKTAAKFYSDLGKSVAKSTVKTAKKAAKGTKKVAKKAGKKAKKIVKKVKFW